MAKFNKRDRYRFERKDGKHMIKIIVAGFKGRMGSTATQMVLETADFELVGVYDPHEAQETVSFNDETAIPVFQRLEEVLAVKPDVWIDFTVPEAAYPNTRFALEHGMAPVVGTTGFTEEQINELTNLSREKAIGGLIAPNFAIGAVLMMQFAQKRRSIFQMWKSLNYIMITNWMHRAERL